MKLIVGLGNPGAKYRDTRHNIGFAILDELARRAGVSFERAFSAALVARRRDLSDDAWLAKPQTFMNASGAAVAEIVRYYRIEFGDMLVIADDVNLPVARLRARPRGSDGGHNGVRSIIERLGTREFPRLRVGVGRGDLPDLADHVLARFDPEEQAGVEGAVARAADAAELFVTAGIDQVMNRFNAEDASQENTRSAPLKSEDRGE